MPAPPTKYFFKKLCKNFWLEETAILDMQMSKLPMISGYVLKKSSPLKQLGQMELNFKIVSDSPTLHSRWLLFFKVMVHNQGGSDTLKSNFTCILIRLILFLFLLVLLVLTFQEDQIHIK
jgi:hypothetical protein